MDLLSMIVSKKYADQVAVSSGGGGGTSSDSNSFQIKVFDEFIDYVLSDWVKNTIYFVKKDNSTSPKNNYDKYMLIGYDEDGFEIMEQINEETPDLSLYMEINNIAKDYEIQDMIIDVFGLQNYVSGSTPFSEIYKLTEEDGQTIVCKTKKQGFTYSTTINTDNSIESILPNFDNMKNHGYTPYYDRFTGEICTYNKNTGVCEPLALTVVRDDVEIRVLTPIKKESN